MMTIRTSCASFAALLAGATVAQAAVSVTAINNAGGNFDYHNDISTTGTLIEAANFGHGSDITVNGVTFGSVPGGNPSGASFTVTDAPQVDDGLGNSGIDDLFFTEVWVNGGTPTLTVTGLNPSATYLIQVLHGEPRSCCAATWANNTVATDVDAASNVPSFNIGNGTNGQNPPGAGDIAIITAQVSGATNFTYVATGGGGRGGSLAGFQVRLIPEPSSMFLLGCGGLVLLRRRRQ